MKITILVPLVICGLSGVSAQIRGVARSKVLQRDLLFDTEFDAEERKLEGHTETMPPSMGGSGASTMDSTMDETTMVPEMRQMDKADDEKADDEKAEDEKVDKMDETSPPSMGGSGASTMDSTMDETTMVPEMRQMDKEDDEKADDEKAEDEKDEDEKDDKMVETAPPSMGGSGESTNDGTSAVTSAST
jgi:hypothetical protein